MTLAAKGIDIRMSSGQIVFRCSLKNSSGVDVVSGGPFVLRLFALQSDGTLQPYDWTNNVFTAGTPTADSATMVHRTYTNQSAGSNNSGIWTYALSTLTGFTSGMILIAKVTDTAGTTTAVPVSQEREFQFGGDQGDQTAQSNDVGALLATNGIETGVNLKQALEAISAMLTGIVSGGGTGTEVFKAIGAAAGGTTRVTVTDDSSGNRSAVSLNL